MQVCVCEFDGITKQITIHHEFTISLNATDIANEKKAKTHIAVEMAHNVQGPPRDTIMLMTLHDHRLVRLCDITRNTSVQRTHSNAAKANMCVLTPHDIVKQLRMSVHEYCAAKPIVKQNVNNL